MSNELKKISSSEFIGWMNDHTDTLYGRFVLSILVTIFFVFTTIFSYKDAVYEFSEFLGVSFFHLAVSIIATAFLSIFLFLFQKLKFPKTKYNKAGIYFAFFDIYKTKTSQMFMDKIYKEVEIEISKIDPTKIFNIVFLKQHLAKDIIKNEQRIFDATKNITNKRRKINLSFLPDITKVNYVLLMYGKLKEANVGKEIAYKIEPEYFIKHNPIDELTSMRLGKDLKGLLLSQRWLFQKSKEMEALEIIPDNIRLHVLYAVGISAYLSGLVKIAIDLHQNLYNIIKPRLKSEPYLNKLRASLERIIPSEAQVLGSYFYNKNDIDNAIMYQKKIISIKPNNYNAHLSLANHYYIKDPNGIRYKKEVYYHLNEAEKYPEDSSFKLSKAFLMAAWEDNIDKAVELYIKTLRSNNVSEAIAKATYEWVNKQLKVSNTVYLQIFGGLLLFYKINNTSGKKNLKDITESLKKNSKYKKVTDDILKIIEN
ncbi:MAG: hypothetical protein ISR98_00395 [Parcubacteria group bacterium]|nr:hypothetical protein [Parcubacteria group bacterium]